MKLTLNMNDVEAGYLLQRIGSTLNGEDKSSLVNDSLVSVLNNIYKSITGHDYKEDIQPQLDENINVDLPIELVNASRLLIWCRYYLIQSKPCDDKSFCFNVFLGKVLNDISKQIAGGDHPEFIENFAYNCKLYGNKVMREIHTTDMNSEDLKRRQKELHILSEYIKDKYIEK